MCTAPSLSRSRWVLWGSVTAAGRPGTLSGTVMEAGSAGAGAVLTSSGRRKGWGSAAWGFHSAGHRVLPQVTHTWQLVGEVLPGGLAHGRVPTWVLGQLVLNFPPKTHWLCPNSFS